jgi:hypothetical protein
MIGFVGVRLFYPVMVRVFGCPVAGDSGRDTVSWSWAIGC